MNKNENLLTQEEIDNAIYFAQRCINNFEPHQGNYEECDSVEIDELYSDNKVDDKDNRALYYFLQELENNNFEYILDTTHGYNNRHEVCIFWKKVDQKYIDNMVEEHVNEDYAILNEETNCFEIDNFLEFQDFSDEQNMEFLKNSLAKTNFDYKFEGIKLIFWSKN